mmetsp:Transcript_56752/g.93894  ORF Transcript_56752/g.93894 Transcript_56752/m.93894 type:complete len:117 (+) Transcript_56752:25-375(+)
MLATSCSASFLASKLATARHRFGYCINLSSLMEFQLSNVQAIQRYMTPIMYECNQTLLEKRRRLPCRRNRNQPNRLQTSSCDTPGFLASFACSTRWIALSKELLLSLPGQVRTCVV